MMTSVYEIPADAVLLHGYRCSDRVNCWDGDSWLTMPFTANALCVAWCSSALPGGDGSLPDKWLGRNVAGATPCRCIRCCV